ncbi:MAG: GNAT family N-acetyltransferase [Erysipelotrichaceae bacterium]|nr:GNAT family N-acetyltransferase [Erysipelotrichaceae bacterium]
MNIRIRRTDNEEELLACARLFTENYPWKGLDETFEYNNAKVHSPDEEVYVALDGDKVVGCLLLEMHSTLKAFVRGLVVDEDYRCHKIGAKLLAFIEKRTFHETENVFMYCSSERGIKFYKANGYTPIGVVENLNITGSNETILRKTIGPAHEVKRKGILLSVIDSDAGTFEEAVRNAGEYLYSMGLVRKEYGYKCLEREKIFPTGLPVKYPVAIPHTDSEHCLKNAICFQRLKAPVTVRQMTGQGELESRLIINLAISEPDDQVKVLSRLMDLLQDEEFVKNCLEEEAGQLEKAIEDRLLEN